VTHDAEWHARRKDGIGSSDIAAILGISPWQSDYALWCDKTGFGPSGGAGTERMRWGLAFESLIADEAAKRLGVEITSRRVYVIHHAHSWARAELDAVCDDGDGELVIEVKTTGDRWDRVPDHYQAQVQWQLECAELPAAWVACLHGGQRLTLWLVERETDTGAALIRIAGAWWHRHVMCGEPPPLDGSTATGDALARRYPPLPGLAADVHEVRHQIARLREITAIRRELKTEEGELKNEVKAALGHAEDGQLGGELAVTWRTHNRRTLDQTALRADEPRLFEKYSRTRPVRRLLLAGDKGEQDD
jgi:putative phage-type endonuclease